MATGQSSYSSTGGTTYFDLTTENGDRAEINNALFFQSKPDDSSGTGLIQAIVRVQDTGNGDGFENGYNTSYRPLSYEENTSPNFTTSLVLNSVPVVTIDGVQYYEFRLDINQLNSSSLLSLDAIKVYTSDVSDGQAEGLISGSWFADNATLRYDLDGAGDTSILLDASLSSGSGSSDMFFYIPVSNFGAVDPDVTYVTLYSEFGDADTLDASDGITPLDDPTNTALEDDGVDTGDTAAAIYGTYTANDGFEEWSVSKQTGGIISGFKFGDTDGDGLWDLGETGLGGWTIDYEISYVSGHGNNKQTVTLTGSVVTSDGTTDVDGDGNIDPAGYYTIFVPASTDKKETYTVTLTEDAQSGFINTYDGDATANYTTTFTFTGDDLTLDGSPNVSGRFEETETMNFGNFELFEISGHKYTDITGDGLTSDDTGLGGVTVFIDVNGNNIDDDGYSTVTADGTTDANGDGNIDADDLGYWEITGLGPNVAGAEVKEITPEGYVQTVGQIGTEEDTSSEYTLGTTDQDDIDFANFELFKLSGHKYTDITGDGLSSDDTGLGGVTVFIDVNGNNINDDGYSTVTADGTTDANGDGNIDEDDVGYWEITGLGPDLAGEEVKEITPDGYVQTVGQIGEVTDTEYLITGTSGTDQNDIDFANFEKFDISGHKYTDITGDGLSSDDTGLGGVTVFIDVNGNNVDDDGYSTVTADGTTDANGDGNIDADDVGYWEFLDLDYSVAGAEVKEITPGGYVQTVGQIGTITDTTTDYTLEGTSGADQDDIDFANFEKFDISGHKYTDITGDGLSSDDTGLGGVTVFIDVNGNNVDDDGYSTVTADGTTDANGDGNIDADDVGYWEFLDLDYSVAGAEVKEVTPSGYVQTVGQIGVVTDTEYLITGTSGTDQDDIDFANFLPDPKIDLEKSVKTNLFDYLPEDGDDEPEGLLAATNSTVTFKVVVTNTGNETLSDITLTDSVVHTVNLIQTTQDIVYTPDGDAGTLDAFDVFVDLNNDTIMDAGEEWSNFDTDGDGIIDAGEIAELSPDETFTLYYSLDSLLGQHENTGKVEAVSAISETTVDDSDDANYYVVEEDCVGVRTPGFWSNKTWGTFWDGVSNNQPKQAGTPGFAAGELVYAVDSDGNGVVNALDTNGDGFINGAPKDGVNDTKPIDASVGLLIGDYNKNGIQDGDEDTIFISLADAKTLINASNKQIADGKTADGIYMLGRDVVAAWLNYLANNPDDATGNCIGTVAGDDTNSPREFLDAAIDWLQQFASDANDGGNRLTTDFHGSVDWTKFEFDARVAPSSAAWQNPFTVGEDIPVSAAAMHYAIDGYNNTGTINGIEYCCDAENQSALLALNQIALV